MPGNGLDAFDTEVTARPATLDAPSSPLLEIVAAYPDSEPGLPAWRASARRPLTLRHAVRAALGAARTVAFFPFVVVSWFLLRLWWVIRLAVSGMWHVVIGAVRLVWSAFTATGRGIRGAVVGVVRLLVGAVTGIARGVRAAVYAAGRALARGAALVHSAILTSGRAVVGACVFAGTLIARSTTALVARLASLTCHVRMAGARLTHALHDTGPPVFKVVVPRVPLRVRAPRVVPALVIVLAATAGSWFGVMQPMPSQRQTHRTPTPAPALASVPVPVESAPVPLAVALPVQPSAAVPALAPPPPTRRASTPSVSIAASARAPDVTRSLSPARVRDLWSKTDTRSLDRALTSLRSTTLAFQRCEMRLTSDDRAVAHCDEAGPGANGTAPIRVAWTIDFRRDDGRWLIAGLSSGAAQGLTGGLPTASR